jgi:ribonucleoside-diphosphate reductase alpha chain
MLAAGVPAKKRRSLGVGVCNLAYLIAKNNAKYSDGSANDLIHEYAEAMSYYLIKSSNQMAKEFGPCDWYEETKYSQGILPIDTYKKAVDDTVTVGLKCDWETLRASIKEYGMRNSTVMSLMPVESSSQVINATNGIEPPRSVVSIKGSKDGALKQVVPEIMKLKNKYEYLWDMPHTRGYLEIAAIFQKFTDQSISTNTTYNPKNYPDNKVPMSELMKDVVYAYKLGIKTLYYQNTDDGSGDVWDPDAKQDDEEDCVACKL